MIENLVCNIDQIFPVMPLANASFTVVKVAIKS